jgi:Zn-dependent protease with chaperone function
VGAEGGGGFFLSLLTESFAVRALLGSVAAAGLVAAVAWLGLVHSSRARRLLALAPVLAALVAGLATLSGGGGPYLPQLWVTSSSSAAGRVVDVLGELRMVSTDRVDLLALAYVSVVGVLGVRRLTGALRVRRLLRGGEVPATDDRLRSCTARVLSRMSVRTPRLRYVTGCPGGACAAGVLRPIIAVDPKVIAGLDDHELEGLVAHELAHLRRRDPLLWLGVGLFRDLTFFLPPLFLAVSWLRREQEESADETASAVTGRPGALASSILKVWDRGRRRPRLGAACTAVAGPVSGSATGSATTAELGAAASLTARVQRLLHARPELSLERRAAEIGLAGAVLAVAGAAAIGVPAWISSGLDAGGLSFGYLGAARGAPVESPAFATFRALAAPPQAATEAAGAGDELLGRTADTSESSSMLAGPGAGQAGAGGWSGLAPTRRAESESAGSASLTADGAAGTAPAGCPCVESQAQLANGVAAGAEQRSARMLWRRQGHAPWELRESPWGSARPLWTLHEAGNELGLFLVSRSA